MIFSLLLGVPSAFAFKRNLHTSCHTFIRRCTADDNDQVVQNFLERKFKAPVIFSKQLLFGNSVDEVITSMDEIESSESDSDNSLDSKKSLRGTSCHETLDYSAAIFKIISMRLSFSMEMINPRSNLIFTNRD